MAGTIKVGLYSNRQHLIPLSTSPRQTTGLKGTSNFHSRHWSCIGKVIALGERIDNVASF